MRVMVMVKATKSSEAGTMPSEKLLTDMGKFNDELVKAGIMLAGEGLHPSRKGKRVRFSSGKKTVIDGPRNSSTGVPTTMISVSLRSMIDPSLASSRRPVGRTFFRRSAAPVSRNGISPAAIRSRVSWLVS